MPSQSKNHLVRTIAFVILILGLLQSSCNKNKEQNGDNSKSPYEELFLSDIQGEWIFQTLSRYDSVIVISLALSDDTVYFTNHPADTSAHYSIYDTRVYTLPCIEKIQNFTITENNDSLFLEISDLFGNSSNFHMYYGNLQFYEGTGGEFGGGMPPYFSVNMKIVNQDTVMTFTDFYLSYTIFGIFIKFSNRDGDFFDWTSLKGTW